MTTEPWDEGEPAEEDPVKHRLSHLARMAGNIAAGLVQRSDMGLGMYDADSWHDKIADESVAIAEKIMARLEAVEDAGEDPG